MIITKVKSKFLKYLVLRYLPKDFDPNAYNFFNPDVLNSGLTHFYIISFMADMNLGVINLKKIPC